MRPRREGRFGFVACLGRSNVGKSTLVNKLARQKLGIVSRKPQTTRRRARAIVHHDNAQIVLVDTPGLTSIQNRVNDGLIRETRAVVKDSDAVLAVADPRGMGKEEQIMLDTVRECGKDAILALNKCDLFKKGQGEALMGQYGDLGLFRGIYAVSALKGEGLEKLLPALTAIIPEGPFLFPDDIVSDQPEREFFQEIVREKIFRYLHRELPYAAAVVLEEVNEDESRNLYRVRATIYVERESQKGILIGRGGSALKVIGTAAREDMERLTGARVHLELWVKVRKNWTKDPRSIEEFGFG